MTTQASKELIAKHVLHVHQVQEGLIPADSPPTFTLPEGPDAIGANGMPWFYGPDFHPTPEAVTSFSEIPGKAPESVLEASVASPKGRQV